MVLLLRHLYSTLGYYLDQRQAWPFPFLVDILLLLILYPKSRDETLPFSICLHHQNRVSLSSKLYKARIAYINLHSFFYDMNVFDIADTYCHCRRRRRTLDQLLLHSSDFRALKEQTLWADGKRLAKIKRLSLTERAAMTQVRKYQGSHFKAASPRARVGFQHPMIQEAMMPALRYVDCFTPVDMTLIHGNECILMLMSMSITWP